MTFYRCWWWLAYAVAFLLLRVRVEGRQHIPLYGGVVLASNHTGLADPVIIGVAAGRELWYLAKAELFAVPVIGSLIQKLNAMPVDRNRGDRGALMTWEQQLKTGRAVLLFPEGTRNKTGRFFEPKPGVGMLVYRAQVPVVPVFISGTVHFWKALVGIERVTVRFGLPLVFDFSQLPEHRKSAYQAISRDVMIHIAQLKQRRREAGTVAPASSAQQTA